MQTGELKSKLPFSSWLLSALAPAGAWGGLGSTAHLNCLEYGELSLARPPSVGPLSWGEGGERYIGYSVPVS